MQAALAPWQWLAVIAIFVVAGCVKGVIGLGLPTISMALLAVFMLPSHAAALLVVPSLLSNLWQMRPLRTLGPLLRRTGLLQLGTIIGTLLAGLVWGAPAGAWASVILGVVLCLYAASGLAGWQLPAGRPRRGLFMGLATGVVTAVSGVFVIPAVPYLQSLKLERDGLVQAMGLSFTVSTLALSVNLAAAGAFQLADVATSCALVVPTLVGMSLGGALRQRLSPQAFRRCFLIALLVLGVYLAAGVLLAGASRHG
ncbi:sulfite exporter TauE/SafE family protein [Pseudoxanthomonas sp.]|uniref:sulfite exporter TauE/SafE family protein n=1 Tax=Pseudoxanthomonas sp. TaxID=1871049 RepID=UPI00260922C4|nr:sulfite exporter TauE/SafE family protein [Pseudoxanthomonas sp.]WDS37890.1 MAG: sulfite exporter TauE/SafE family protein [Pseudoxanthomonas sp.]